MGELVSILIPAYNAERWIRDAIRSAVNQTWSRKEIIVVDDGSRDQTLSIARQFASKEVSVVTQANQGAAAARNHAFSICQGDYIQWLDADDLLATDKIARQLESAESGRESMVLLTSSFGRFYVCPERANIEPTSLWRDLSPVDWLINKFNDNVWMNPAAWLVSRRLSALAGSWDERLSLDDDGEYGCRLVAASTMVHFIGGAMSYYRIGNIGSLSTRNSNKAHESLLLSKTLCIQYLMSLEESERSKAASLNVLQTYLPLFYPEKAEGLFRIYELASQLGGRLKPPTINWKHYPLDKILGQAGRVKVVNNWRNLKNLGQKHREKLAYRCFGPTPTPPPPLQKLDSKKSR